MAKSKPVSILAYGRPRNDNVIVQRDTIHRNPDGTALSRGGILLPDSVLPSHRETGTVIAVGPGLMQPNGKRIPLDLKPGDRVLITGYAALAISGSMVEDNDFSDEYVILKEEEVLSFLDIPKE